MKKQKKPLKYKISRVAVVVATVATLFALCCIPIFAQQTGKTYYTSVYSGEQTYPFLNLEKLSTITFSDSSYTLYWKDVPISDVYNVSGLPNYGGVGLPLNGASPDYNVWQTITTDEVKFGVLDLAYVYDSINDFPAVISGLDKNYSQYIDGGNLDCTMVSIDSKQSAGANSRYQKLNLHYADVILSHDMMYGTTGAYRNSTYYDTYINCQRDTTDNLNVPVHLSFTAVGENEGVSIEHYWSDSFYLTMNANGFVDFWVLDLVRERLSNEFINSSYIYIRDIDILVGGFSSSVGPAHDHKLYGDGLSSIGVFMPSIRPYNSAYATDKFNTPQSEYVDINARIKTNSLNVINPTIDNLDVSPVGRFFASITGAVLDVSIFPGITLGAILFSVISVGVVVMVIKFFAGG